MSTDGARNARHQLPLDVSVRREGGHPVIVLRGELDLSTVGLLETTTKSIAAEDHDLVVVDLRGLNFLDSVGVRALLELASLPRREGVKVAFVRGSGAVARVLSMTRLDAHLWMIDDPAEVSER